MLNLLKTLRQDENGVILSTEIVIIGSLLVIGMITGLTCLQKSVNGELRDVANAIGSLDQSYSFSAHRKSGFGGQCFAYTAGSAFSNCERKGEDSCGDIVGCHAIGVPLHDGGCGNCNSGTISEGSSPCGSCGAADACGTCGSCGGTVGGCSACGSGYPGGWNGPRRIDPDVPKMKVTEWPAFPNDWPADNGVQFHESEIIFEHTVPSADPQPMPVPEDQPLPVPSVPTASAVDQFGGGFNFPSHVW